MVKVKGLTTELEKLLEYSVIAGAHCEVQLFAPS